MLTKFFKWCPKTTTIRSTTQAREPQSSVQVVPEQNEPITRYGKLMARAVGSSAAILAGASLDEVVSHGGWVIQLKNQRVPARSHDGSSTPVGPCVDALAIDRA